MLGYSDRTGEDRHARRGSGLARTLAAIAHASGSRVYLGIYAKAPLNRSVKRFAALLASADEETTVHPNVRVDRAVPQLFHHAISIFCAIILAPIRNCDDPLSGRSTTIMSMNYDYLDAIVMDVRHGDTSRVGVLSTGERLYVALAASNCALLGNDSIAYAIDRIGHEALRELVARHRLD